MAALQRAIALPKVHDVAVAVGEDLHLDVPRLLDVFLEVDAAVLEGVLGFLLGGLEAGLQADVVAGDAHAAAAAAGRRLDQHGIAHLVGQLAEPRLRSSISPSLPGTTGTPACLASLRASFLLPSSRIASCGGPMNSMLQARQTSAKCGVFGEEAVAGMDGLDVGDLGRADDRAGS